MTPQEALKWYVDYHEGDGPVVTYEEYVAVAKDALNPPHLRGNGQ